MDELDATAPPDALPAPPLPDAATPWALFLDVDGSLVGFTSDPAAVRIPAPLRALLAALHTLLDGALALVSGRSLADLDRLFGAPVWACAGLHGTELRLPDGTSRLTLPAPGEIAAMRATAHDLAARFPDLLLEDKRSAIALHNRGGATRFAALAAAAREQLPALAGYALQEGHDVVEFKPAAMDKGRAIDALMALPPFRARRPVYVGDDLTDEHGFARVNAGGGIAVRVGARQPTAARHGLAGPAATGAWLAAVHATLETLSSQGDPRHVHHHGGTFPPA